MAEVVTTRTLLDLASVSGDPGVAAEWRIRDSVVLLSDDGVLNVLNPPAAQAWLLHREGLSDEAVSIALAARTGLDYPVAAASWRRLLDHLHRSGCRLDQT